MNIIGVSFNSSDVQFKIGTVTSQPKGVTIGLEQGDVLSPMLFDLVLKNMIQEMNILRVTLGLITIEYFAYADDIALLKEKLDMMKRLQNKLLNTTKKVGLTINDNKTENLIAEEIGIVDKNNIQK